MTPHVTCVCLTADRQQLTDRAVQCFLDQTYPNKSLLIWDNGKVSYQLPLEQIAVNRWRCYENIHLLKGDRGTVGQMRNWANTATGLFPPETEIVAHWDSDDWSHPLRLAFQVSLLKEYKTELVGYRSMMFWRDGEAWDYNDPTPHGKIIGTSMCYWRRTWEQKPFRDVNRGEDNDWQRELVVRKEEGFFKDEPAMVARILPDGAGGWYDFDGLTKSTNWTRCPDWDARIRGLLG